VRSVTSSTCSQTAIVVLSNTAIKEAKPEPTLVHAVQGLIFRF